MTAGCAAVPSRPSAPGRDDAIAGWDALAEGGRADAQALFDRRLRAAPADAVALFGRASIDYEMGRSEAALDGYAAVLAALGPSADAGRRGRDRAGRRGTPEHAV